MVENQGVKNRPFATNDHDTKSAMLEGKLIIILALGHQNKETSTSQALPAFASMCQCGNNNETSPPAWRILYHVIVCCIRPIRTDKVMIIYCRQRAYGGNFSFCNK